MRQFFAGSLYGRVVSPTSLFLSHLRILYATGESEDLDIDEVLRDSHLCLF